MYIGIDIGGTKAHFALADSAGNIKATLKTPSGIYDHTWPDVLVSGITKLIEENKFNAKDIKAIGAGVPDITVEFEGKKATLREPVKAHLEKKFGVPVRVENDGSLAALGEFNHGAGKGRKNMVYLILGTGVGGGIIIDGKLFRGATGRAGEFGHMSVAVNGPACGCGNQGCLHLYASGASIARNALQRIAARKDKASKIIQLAGPVKDVNELVQKVTSAVVVQAAQQGDAIAKETLAEFIACLGVAIKSLINIFNPEIIVLGGGLMAAEEVLLPPLKEEVKKGVREELFGSVDILRSVLGNEAGLFGAVDIALQGC